MDEKSTRKPEKQKQGMPSYRTLPVASVFFDFVLLEFPMIGKRRRTFKSPRLSQTHGSTHDRFPILVGQDDLDVDFLVRHPESHRLKNVNQSLV